jgi:uncharacterized protein (TIGR03086 family)
MNAADLHRQACELFDRAVGQIRPDQWAAPTPCAGWDVRTLVNHVAAEELWTPPLMAGRTIAEVGDRFDGDVLGEDPVAAHDEAAGAAIEAVAADGALERTVHLSFGDVPAEEYAMQLFTDHLVHAWDLARAIGADEQLEHELVRRIHAETEKEVETLAATGRFDPPVHVPAHADLQARMLGLFGRRS